MCPACRLQGPGYLSSMALWAADNFKVIHVHTCMAFSLRKTSHQSPWRRNHKRTSHSFYATPCSLGVEPVVTHQTTWLENGGVRLHQTPCSSHSPASGQSVFVVYRQGDVVLWYRPDYLHLTTDFVLIRDPTGKTMYVILCHPVVHMHWSRAWWLPRELRATGCITLNFVFPPVCLCLSSIARLLIYVVLLGTATIACKDKYHESECMHDLWFGMHDFDRKVRAAHRALKLWRYKFMGSHASLTAGATEAE